MEELDFFSDYNESYTEIYDEDCCEELLCDGSTSLHFDSMFIPVLYSLVVVVGLVGNGLVLVGLRKRRLNLNVTDILIFHLSLADTLLLLTLPFSVVQAAKEWIFGNALCKLTGALFKISFYCGIFMLSCISLDQYLSIVHAVQMYRKKPMMIHCCCLTVWLFCLLLSMSEWRYLVAIKDSRRQDKTECVMFYPSDSWHLLTRLLYHILGFALPALMMLFCYSCILLRLRRGSQDMQKKRAIRVIVALILSFFISWTPLNITLIIDMQKDQIISNQTSCDSGTALDIALTITSVMGLLHYCVRPVLYGFLGPSLANCRDL